MRQFLAAVFVTLASAEELDQCGDVTCAQRAQCIQIADGTHTCLCHVGYHGTGHERWVEGELGTGCTMVKDQHCDDMTLTVSTFAESLRVNYIKIYQSETFCEDDLVNQQVVANSDFESTEANAFILSGDHPSVTVLDHQTITIDLEIKNFRNCQVRHKQIEK